MPEEDLNPVQSQTPASQLPKPKKSKKKFILLGVIFILILAVTAGGLCWFFYKSKGEVSPKSESQSEQKVAKANRVIGKSSGKLPYAAIDEDRVVSAVFDSFGGVLQTSAAKNVKIYFVVKEGEVATDATISLLPYKEMPSAKTHGELSDELGYGVQVEIISIQSGIGGYLVFDTKGGEAVSAAQKKFGPAYNRCDPHFRWFDPLLCARLNKVSAEKVVDKELTVITPVFDSKMNKITLRETIPTGIDGLLVVKVKKGDVYIPQKLDKELVSRFLNKPVSTKYEPQQWSSEDAAQALAWQIEPNLDQLDSIAGTLIVEQPDFSALKALYLAKSFINYPKAKLEAIVKKSSEVNEGRKQFGENPLKSADDLLKKLEETFDKLKKEFTEWGVVKTKKIRNESSVIAVAAISGAKEIGIEGADSLATQSETMIENQVSTYADYPVDALAAGEASQYVPSVDETINNIKADAKATIDTTLADPNASIVELLEAGRLAKLTMDPAEADKVWEEILAKIKKKLEEDLKKDLNSREALEKAWLAAVLGFDDLKDKFIEKANKAIQTAECDLIHKTLANFGINECQ
jgi:hypothetical protein